MSARPSADSDAGRLRELHQPDPQVRFLCGECTKSYPCRTIEALDALESAVSEAIRVRVALIRSNLPDIVPGNYQHGFADGLESALAEFRACVTPPAETGADQ